LARAQELLWSTSRQSWAWLSQDVLAREVRNYPEALKLRSQVKAEDAGSIRCQAAKAGSIMSRST
jgi:hypothetical protein